MRVYIETTIPSFYYNSRPEPKMIARQLWTREWWDSQRQDVELVSSALVLDELEDGDYANQQDCIDLLSDIPLLPLPPDLSEIVALYLQHRLMPRRTLGDAAHLAFASWHKCDVLLTWNCEHLANANKFQHIRVVNTLLGLYVPTIITPMQLLGGTES